MSTTPTAPCPPQPASSLAQAGTGPSTIATIAIIGAGFSGTAVAIALLDGLPVGSRLVLIERGERLARGVAYGTRSSSHWLNVPAGRLGLDPDDEGAFNAWLQAQGGGYGPADFVPRMLLGDYLADALAQASRQALARGLALERHQAEVTSLTPQADGRWSLGLSDDEPLLADQVVLACGHLPPALPHLPAAPGTTALHWGEPGLEPDPWAPDLLASLPEDGELLVLGTGLTAIDVVTALQDRGHTGLITLLSRRGLLPQPHRRLEARPRLGLSPVAELGEEHRLGPIVKAVRRWAAAAQAEGRDWRDVMASMRSCTPGLWQRLSLRDRRQFLRHVQPWWDTHRHRLAPGLHLRLNAARAAGQVALAVGRLRQTERLPNGRIRVQWQPRGSVGSGAEVTGTVSRVVDAIVNCTGASTGLSQARAPLLASLREQGLLTPDPLDLGLLVDEQYRPLGPNGEPAEGLFYVGPMLKAQCWEAIAIPELRVHARQLAQAVLRGLVAGPGADGAAG